ncbi:hypothetical protein Acr_18g0011790 [Actinidia rufa]|uniref:Uncharacterized protein n=1 Tax=Actinidia rufa TaxID=165716 RepID=A0A7J0G8A2_9ERIC|nr:hypothetical protein Acr_18g0011790 [Actinidia rufa]
MDSRPVEDMLDRSRYGDLALLAVDRLWTGRGYAGPVQVWRFNFAAFAFS